jgi:two-component system sensor histidine kinase/response regulator
MSILEYLSLAALAIVSALALMLHRQVSQARQFARKDAEKFKKLFEEIPLASQEINRNGVIRRVNQKLCDLRGLPASRILGKHYADFGPESDRERVRNETHRKLAGEEPLAPGQQTYVRGDCDVVTVQVQEVLLRDENGAVEGLRSYELDVTERIRREEEIWQTTGELRAIFQALPDGFLRMDTGGVILDYRGPKPSGFLGRAQDPVGKRIQNLVSPEVGRQIDKAIARVQKTNAMVAIEYSLPSEGGETYFEARLIPLHWKEIIVIVRDNAERKRAEKRLEQYAEEVQQKNDDLAAALATAREATLMKGRFLANMSHEIRTPMNGVLGMTDLLLDTPLNEEQREYAEAVKQSAGALLTVINDILDLSKIEAGRLTMECAPFDIIAIVNETIAWFAIRARAKGLELDSILPADAALLVRGDPGRLRQVLTNLIGNAIKFTEAGKVGVRLETLGSSAESLNVKFYVEDTGIGVSSEHRGRIFQAFMQGDSSTTRRYGGTGLGLAISKQLVELLGGDIGVESERGRGSTFWFSAVFERQRAEELSTAQAPTVTATEAEVEPEPIARLDGMRILVVASASSKATNLRETLNSWGCETDQMSGATWVVPELRLAVQTGTPFHVALLDLDTPGLDMSISREIAADPLVFDTNLIAMTSNRGQTHDARLRENGFMACLSKPVSSADLHQALVNISLPEAAPAAEPRVPAKQALESRQPRVLLAEDNPVNQKLVLRLLEKAGLKADVVANGSQAVAAIGKAAYDLVLMDCQMPEMDGFEATAEIRRLEGNARHTTICALTAHAMAGDRERCIDAGMDDYISKPLTTGILHTKIAHWIYSKQAEPVESQSFGKTA